MELSVYTDGSCHGNPGVGGAGAVFVAKIDGKEQAVGTIVHAGGQTSNNQMELTAVILTFKYLPKDTKIVIFTDSKYVSTGLNEWTKKWVANGWKTATKQPVKNMELWKQLLALQKEYPDVSIKWVRAHNGHEWNERADALANEGTAKSNKGMEAPLQALPAHTALRHSAK